ncbi:hypothetical protein BDV06DRAFT_135823 [Aspergillus oleicola]
MDNRRPIRKRNRRALSCYVCRDTKVKCDRVKPTCGRCAALGLTADCTYEENPRPRPVNHSHASNETRDDTQGRSRVSTPGSSPPPKRMRMEGTISKTRVFGNGHWMNTFSLVNISDLQPVGESYQAFSSVFSDPQSGHLAQTIQECKKLGREIKAHRPSRKCLPSGIHRSLPDRKVMDELVELYFATFHTCYGIFCRNSFMAEYAAAMEKPEAAEGPLIILVLLIATVTGPICSEDPVRRQIAANAGLWIDMAQTWLSAPLEKNRLTIKAIQIYSLLLLSRQVNQIGADLVWISAGSLVRMAMQMGLHQDPDLLGKVDPPDKILRRQIWYTILEMDVQAAMDSGMSPVVADADYNTKPPSNDESAGDQTDVPGSTSSAANTALFQSILAKSLPLRSQIARTVNSMQEEPSYEQVIDLGNKLSSACSGLADKVAQITSTSNYYTGVLFSVSFCSHLLGRFSLCLHYRYAIRASRNPLYNHSRQACLEAAWDLVNFLDIALYAPILRQGGGMFRDHITRGAFVIFLELGSNHETDTSIFARKRNRDRLESLLDNARRMVQHAKDRVSFGDMNVKAYVCVSMMLAQAEARLDGIPAKDAVQTAMQRSLDVCRDILQETKAAYSTDGGYPGLETSVNDGSLTPGLDVNFESDLDGIFDFDFSDSQFNLPMQWIGC